MPRALVHDSRELYVGRTIWVRNKEAVVIGVDYPLVFWEYNGSDQYSHRPFNVIKEVLEVDTKDARPFDDDADPQGASTEPDSSSDDESPVEQLAPAPEPRKPPGKLRMSLEGMLAGIQSQRDHTVRYENISREHTVDETSGLAQSIHIDGCSNAQFVFTKKVNHITLLNCSNVTVSAVAIISSIDVISSEQCEVFIGSTGTVNFDRTPNSLLRFPVQLNDVHCFAISSPGLTCVGDDAVNDQVENKDSSTESSEESAAESAPESVDASHNDQALTRRQYVLPKRVRGIEPEAMPTQQFLILYKDNKFSLTPLQRDSSGRITNL